MSNYIVTSSFITAAGLSPAQQNLYLAIIQLSSTLLIIYFVYKKFNGPFNEYIDKRTKFINGNIQKAKEDAEIANKTKAEVLEEKANLKKDRIKVLEEAQSTGKQAGAEIIASSKEQARLIIKKAHEELENDKRQAQAEIADEIMEIVKVASERFLSGNISDEVQNKMISEAIAKVSNEK